MAEARTRVRRGPRRGPPGQRSWSVTLTGEHRDAAVARTHARRMLGSVDAAVVDDVVVVVSELVTNAVLHGRDPIVMTLTLDLPEVIVAVTDRGGADPSTRSADNEEEHGRGLTVIQQLASHWHVEHDRGTKSVIAVVSSLPDT